VDELVVEVVAAAVGALVVLRLSVNVDVDEADGVVVTVEPEVVVEVVVEAAALVLDVLRSFAAAAEKIPTSATPATAPPRVSRLIRRSPSSRRRVPALPDPVISAPPVATTMSAVTMSATTMSTAYTTRPG
jgi:hypothetical protein